MAVTRIFPGIHYCLNEAGASGTGAFSNRSLGTRETTQCSRKTTSAVALYPIVEMAIWVVPGEMPLTVNVALPATSVTASDVTVATVGDVLFASTFIPKIGPPCLSNTLTNSVCSEPEWTFSLWGLTTRLTPSP